MANLFVPRQRLAAKQLNDVFGPLQGQVDAGLVKIQADLNAKLAQMVTDSTANLTSAISGLIAQQQQQAQALATNAAQISNVNSAQNLLAPKNNPILTGNVQIPTPDSSATGAVATTAEWVRNLFAGANKSGANVNGTWALSPDGRLRQEGVITTSSTGGNTITFPRAFTNGCTAIVGSVVGNTINTNVFCVSFGGQGSLSGINVYVTLNGAPIAFPVAWMAVGV